VGNGAATAREKELIRAIPDAELVNAIASNVKVAAAGMTQVLGKLKKQQKKGHAHSAA
jgi:hypothetical protein